MMRRFKQIVLHAGLSKTGSTHLQENCGAQRDLLAQQGVVYPQFSFAGTDFANHSVAITCAFAAKPEQYILGLRQQYAHNYASLLAHCQAQLQQVLDDCAGDTLLLSTELLENFEPEDQAAIIARLTPHTQKLRVLVYVRNPQSALESLLQERLKAGAVLEPDMLVGRTRAKYERLMKGFPFLEAYSFHDAKKLPKGLLGHFSTLLGLADVTLSQQQSLGRNERMSAEAYALMSAINRKFPKKEQSRHGVPRQPQDLNMLLALPGKPFRIPGFSSSAISAACVQEAKWLEARLGFQFPSEDSEHSLSVDIEMMWQPETLEALGSVLGELPHVRMRKFMVHWLQDEASNWVNTRPEVAQNLLAISSSLLQTLPK